MLINNLSDIISDIASYYTKLTQNENITSVFECGTFVQITWNSNTPSSRANAFRFQFYQHLYAQLLCQHFFRCLTFITFSGLSHGTIFFEVLCPAKYLFCGQLFR